MSSTTRFLTIAAVMAVILAGAVMIGGTSAEPEDDTEAAAYTVTYDLGAAKLPVLAGEDHTVILYDASDVEAYYTAPQGEKFVGWKTAEGVLYGFGATVAVPAEGLTLVPNTVAVTTISFVVDGKSYDVEWTDADSLAIPEDAIRATVKEGYAFDGWTYDGKTYKTIDEIKAIDGLGAGAVFTASFHESFSVTWIVDGITIATGTTEDLSKPIDPTKDHYTFDAWYDSQGVKYTADYKITADTTFTAKFEPVMYAVTFSAGDYQATVYVPYGQCATPLALPEGFEAWDFDFSKPITGDVTISGIEASVEPTPEPTYWTVTLTVDGVEYMQIYTDRMPSSIEAPSKEGMDFMGWAIAGGSTTINPLTYEYTGDTVLVALFSESEPEQVSFWSTSAGLCVIVVLVIVLAVVIGVMVWKRAEINAGMVKLLTRKQTKGGEQ